MSTSSPPDPSSSSSGYHGNRPMQRSTSYEVKHWHPGAFVGDRWDTTPMWWRTDKSYHANIKRPCLMSAHWTPIINQIRRVSGIFLGHTCHRCSELNSILLSSLSNHQSHFLWLYSEKIRNNTNKSGGTANVAFVYKWQRQSWKWNIEDTSSCDKSPQFSPPSWIISAPLRYEHKTEWDSSGRFIQQCKCSNWLILMFHLTNVKNSHRRLFWR